MPLQKQTLTINFSQGLDQKTDPKQVAIGKFLALENSVFTKGGLLEKRNGYGNLPVLPLSASYLTTFNGDLMAIGNDLQALSTGSGTWVTKGEIQPIQVSTMSLVRNNLNQTYVDSVISPNGFICTVYTENNGSTTTYQYVIADSTTGQNIVPPTALAADSVFGTPKVFLLSNYFIVVYSSVVSATEHLSYIAIQIRTPTNVTSPVSITGNYAAATTVSWDGMVLNNILYLAWNGGSSSGIHMTLLTSTLVLGNTTVPDASHSATVMSVTADTSTNTVWASYYDSATSAGYSVAVSVGLVLQTHFPVQIISTGTILNITGAAQGGILQVFYEVSNSASGIQCNLVSSVQVTQSSGSVSSPIVSLRSVGLASKAFIINKIVYYLAFYSSPFQPTFFLVNGSLSTSANPVLEAKLAYENGGSYLVSGLPSVSVIGTTASVGYRYKDLIQALSNANESGTVTQGGIYSQTGINLANFTVNPQGIVTSEIGANLNITGGFLWGYDGYSITEQGFHLWPDSVQSTANATTGGFLSAQIYFYQIIYEWSDNQGNIFRSAGSIPISVDLTGSGTSTNTITLTIPTLRVTAKTANPVKIVIYRWSTAQQEFFQTTSITAPLINSTTTDSVTFLDTHADATILGNSLIYTTGGVIEDIGAPATNVTTIFDDRLWLVDAEDPNLLWFSKQVIEATPVEMSDLLTIYVNPNVGATGPTGPVTAIFPMDDKLCIFKKNAINYINGTGPDNTGANNQYSPVTFIQSAVGCTNQNSIVYQPEGLMFEFQSEAGNQIWILTRQLQTQYIGAPVEEFTKNATVLSSVTIPGTNQVRFNLSSGITLMYDYYYAQWGTFSTNALFSTLYNDLHTYLSPYGTVLQETPGAYLDGGNPVLLSFTTGWINLAGLQGYQRVYDFLILADYVSPHFMVVQVAYDYAPSPLQQRIIAPNNYTGNFGSDQYYGQTTPYGGMGNREQWRVQVERQTCQSFQIRIQEVFNPFFATVPGAGFKMSGLDLKIGIKKGSRPISAANSV